MSSAKCTYSGRYQSSASQHDFTSSWLIGRGFDGSPVTISANVRSNNKPEKVLNRLSRHVVRISRADRTLEVLCSMQLQRPGFFRHGKGASGDTLIRRVSCGLASPATSRCVQLPAVRCGSPEKSLLLPAADARETSRPEPWLCCTSRCRLREWSEDCSAPSPATATSALTDRRWLDAGRSSPAMRA